MFFLTLPLLTAVLPQIPIKTAARDAKTANAAANVAAQHAHVASHAAS